ncbi:MAG: hypothetical protein J6Z03_06100 [Erysipelotrichaceae bacterium]|nr:hypothetical protein [Erysipelotrichaceae bacterium]
MELLMKYSGITAIVFYGAILYLILKFGKKKGIDDNSEEVKEEYKEVISERLDPEDQDATVACLVAAIDCREQYHKNVQIIGVRRIS